MGSHGFLLLRWRGAFGFPQARPRVAEWSSAALCVAGARGAACLAALPGRFWIVLLQ